MEKFKLPNLVTYIGAASSVCSMILAFNNQIKMAMICLIIAAVSDLFDGAFARKFKRTETEKLIGIELDSLSDVISFLICPVIIVLGIGARSWYSYMVCVLYVISGITRLAVFNVNAAENRSGKKATHYNGLPISYSAVSFPIIWFTSKCLTQNQLVMIYTILMLILAYLFVANIKIPKPRGKALIVLSIVALVAIIGLCFV